MATQSLAHPEHETTPLPRSTSFADMGSSSCTATKSSRVISECRGFASHGHCSHVEAASIAARKSAVCDSCGTRHWYSDLREVHEEDGLLSWYAGDRLCRRCIGQGAWA
jgi:hypothetical protein